ncbi:hypothetical protein WJX84_011240 [Apatococcus fuscideae]|uniref:SET domain-containing protein n=1 Tax=Apatococcus fuscideae TaxID=2026836 RepID=A0AAW1T2Z1_9CHLO
MQIRTHHTEVTFHVSFTQVHGPVAQPGHSSLSLLGFAAHCASVFAAAPVKKGTLLWQPNQVKAVPAKQITADLAGMAHDDAHDIAEGDELTCDYSGFVTPEWWGFFELAAIPLYEGLTYAFEDMVLMLNVAKDHVLGYSTQKRCS